MRWTIRRKIVLLGVVTALAGTMFVGGGTALVAQDIAESQLLTGVTVHSETSAAVAHDFVSRYRTQVRSYASDGLIQSETAALVDGREDDPSALNRHLREDKLAVDPSVQQVSILSLDGTVIASTDADEIGLDEADDVYFRHGLNGTYLTAKRQTEHVDGHFLAAAAPVPAGERTVGVVVLYLSTDALRERLSTDPHIDDSVFTDIEHYLVHADDGHIMFRTLRDEAADTTLDTAPVERCEAGRDFNGSYVNHAGERVYGVATCFPDMSLLFLSELERATMMRPAYRILGAVVASAFLVGAFLVLLTAFLGSRIARPLREMGELIHDLSTGEDTGGIPPHLKDREDEIGDLAQAFSRLLKSVKLARDG